jgi:hypothetical protein
MIPPLAAKRITASLSFANSSSTLYTFAPCSLNGEFPERGKESLKHDYQHRLSDAIGMWRFVACF